MNSIIIFVTIIIIIICIYYINSVNDQIYTSIPLSQQVTEKKNKKIITNSSVDCNNGCPTNTNDNKLFKLYKDYHGSRADNKSLNKKINSSPVGPANIFIIRHGEKVNSLVSLDCNGIYRSCYNLHLLEEINRMGFGIDFIVTANPDILSGAMHIEQTIMAVSWLMDIPLFIFGSMGDPAEAVSNVYKNHLFNNKNILFCWEHTCIQNLLLNIIKIGPATKKKKNKAFINKNGKLALPYWASNNYQSVIYLDEDFNDTIFSSGIKTCFKKDNEKLIFGKQQICSG
jgi:hypothetical protein